MEVGLHGYNIADDSAKETIDCKTFEEIVWDADHCNKFAERPEQLGVEDKLTEWLQKVEIDVDETRKFISHSLLKAADIFTKKITVLPRARCSPKWFDYECKEGGSQSDDHYESLNVTVVTKIVQIMWTTKIKIKLIPTQHN